MAFFFKKQQLSLQKLEITVNCPRGLAETTADTCKRTRNQRHRSCQYPDQNLLFCIAADKLADDLAPAD